MILDYGNLAVFIIGILILILVAAFDIITGFKRKDDE